MPKAGLVFHMKQATEVTERPGQSWPVNKKQMFGQALKQSAE